MAAQVGFDPQPLNLVGKIVRLVPLTMDHDEGVLAAGADESIWDFFAVPAPTNLEEARSWIRGRLTDQQAGQRLPFAVITLADGKFAGSTGYSSINRHHFIGSHQNHAFASGEFQREYTALPCDQIFGIVETIHQFEYSTRFESGID